MILAVNAGSSSIKVALFDDRDAGSSDADPIELRDLPVVLKGGVSGLHGDAPHVAIRMGDRVVADEPLGTASPDGVAALERVFDELRKQSILDSLSAISHRIVHGGHDFTAPAQLDASTLHALRDLTPLAPLHQPFSLRLVDIAARAAPHAVQIGCFDTAFHADRPRLARLYGLPRELSDEGIVSYGFHGLSYAFIASELRQRYGANAGGRVIVAHMGNGVSLCALRDGRSVATTMGFSVLDGPIMGTRSGSIDPGVLLHLLHERGMSVEQLTDLLYKQSGLLGVSGISGDMSTLLQAQSTDPHVREAVDLFVYRVGREMGSLAAALGGVDRIVFTGGIGEHAAEIRDRIRADSAWLNVAEAIVMPTNEELSLARGVLEWRAARRD